MLAFALPALAAFTPYEQLKAARVQDPRTSALVSPLDGLAAGRSLVVVLPCADTYVPEPPCCTYGLRVPASCVPYVPEAQGSSSARGSYCTAYVKPRACHAYRVPCGASQVLPQLGEFDSAEMCEQLVAVADDLQAGRSRSRGRSLSRSLQAANPNLSLSPNPNPDPHRRPAGG